MYVLCKIALRVTIIFHVPLIHQQTEKHTIFVLSLKRRNIFILTTSYTKSYLHVKLQVHVVMSRIKTQLKLKFSSYAIKFVAFKFFQVALDKNTIFANFQWCTIKFIQSDSLYISSNEMFV